MSTTCVLCGRIGTRDFRDSHGAPVCVASRSCLRRHRAAHRRRDTAASRRQDRLVLFNNLAPPLNDGTYAMEISISYAADRLGFDYGLDSVLHEKIITEMAAEMDDAWFTTANEWITEHDQWLRSIPTYPRECWCGQWPMFGTFCHYHGPYTCLERIRAYYGEPDLWALRKPGRSYGFSDEPKIDLPGSCPVHPGKAGAPVPPDVVGPLHEHLNQHQNKTFVPGGRPYAVLLANGHVPADRERSAR